MEDKENFVRGIELFKGYNSAFLANMVMNVKKRMYNFNEIIYEEGSDKKKIYFIKQGEVELSKRVILQHPYEIKYDGLPQIKKRDRLVVAQKQANDWFGEVEIMQKIPRFTRARCVSSKLEIYYISDVKFLSNLNVEEIMNDLKRSSEMLNEWRNKHYNLMLDRIYIQKDPLLKTFANMQFARNLIN